MACYGTLYQIDASLPLPLQRIERTRYAFQVLLPYWLSYYIAVNDTVAGDTMLSTLHERQCTCKTRNEVPVE